MKFLAIIFFSILAMAWFYFSWFILKNPYINTIQINSEIITAILLWWVFTFWFLLAKLIYKDAKEEINSKWKIEKNKIEKEFFLPDIKEIEEEKIYKNYERDYEITKDSIDTILDEKEENYKHKVNLKEEILKKDLEEIIEIKKKNEVEIIDHTLLNVANNLKKQKKQDLKIIEWIWPKIEILLNKNWIYSYKNLANSEVSKLKQILEKANKRYLKLHNPTTWPKQAQLANLWDFEKLKEYQDKLVKGIEK